MDYFRQLLELLRIEREEDRKSYESFAAKTSVSERRANGFTWYPIAIRGTEPTRGDYVSVEVERTTHTDVNHQLRFGAAAMLFSNHDPQQDRAEGTITWQSGNRLKITLRIDELPEWASDGKLGIDLLFDDNSYEEMQSALKYAEALTKQKDEHKLIDVLTGERQPTFNETLLPTINPRLNASQNEAVNRILAANELAVVHGPPGTGKTTTLVQAIKAIIKQSGEQVLVVAPSNAAADLRSEKLSEEGLNVLRVGNPARVSDRLMALTLDSRMSAHPAMKEVKNLKKRAAEFKNMAHKYKRNFGKAEREQRKALFDEAHRIMKDVDNTEQYIADDLTSRAQVIAATLVGANHYTVRNLKYHTVVIDEAGQAIEPACWIPIVKAQKLVLAGDHCQLPPTIKSQEAARKGLEKTLLEKCVARYPQAVVLLQEQYRMHRHIMGYSSSVFYGGKLQAHTSVAEHVLTANEPPVEYIDTAGCGYDEEQEGTSTTNPQEAALLIRHLTALIAGIGSHYPNATFPTIAIISPYKQQIHVLNELLDHSPELQPYKDKISVNTIDSFQGQERDIVYISLTRSNADGVIGFLSDIRRMNVAMTRARKKLVVFGDSATLARHAFYGDFIEYVTAIDGYRSAWEYVDV